MKKLFFILPFILLLSCSVQKRKYQKGFYVSNHKHKEFIQANALKNQKKETEPGSSALKSIPIRSEINEYEIVSASSENTFILFTPSYLKHKNSNPDSLCDKIILRNGDETMVKVLEITPNDVKYKKCDSPDGPLYVVKKADVFMVTFANGTKEVFKTESTEPTTSKKESNSTKDNYNGPQKMHPLAIWSIVAGILGFFTYGIGSVLAILFAKSAIKKIKSNPKHYKGEVLANIGKILGWIVIGAFAILILVGIIALILYI